MANCTICKKRAVSGNAVSHSQIHTKRKFKPNLQKVNGLIVCTRCLKTIKKIQREDSNSAEIPAEVKEFEEVKVEQIAEDTAEAEAEKSEK